MNILKCKLYRIISYFTKTDKSNIKFLIKLGFINSDLKPIMCHKCGCKKFTEKVVDRLDGNLILEKNILCAKCNTINGYWSYGHYIP